MNLQNKGKDIFSSIGRVGSIFAVHLTNTTYLTRFVLE